MNKNKHYLISDASRQVQVEAHVLRYWEDELGLPIPRNELGHRYYTEFHIQLFRQIKQLKEQGYQLKAIRGILGKVEENQKTEPEALLEAQAQAVFRETGTGERNMSRQENMEMKKNTEVENKETELPQAEVSQPLAGEKMRQFQEIMNQVIGRAIEENSEKLSQDVSYLVHDKLMKELEYLMRVSDEREEERFKRLDEVIRAYQRNLFCPTTNTIYHSDPFHLITNFQFLRNPLPLHHLTHQNIHSLLCFIVHSIQMFCQSVFQHIQ